MIRCLRGLFRGLIMCNATAFFFFVFFGRLYERSYLAWGLGRCYYCLHLSKNQIAAGGHLSSWNDGNGLCKVKPYKGDAAVTSWLLNLFSVLSPAVTENIWCRAGKKAPMIKGPAAAACEGE